MFRKKPRDNQRWVPQNRRVHTINNLALLILYLIPRIDAFVDVIGGVMWVHILRLERPAVSDMEMIFVIRQKNGFL